MSDYVDEKTVKETAKIKWNASQDLRAEFTDFETFLAYQLAMANGQVQVMGKVN